MVSVSTEIYEWKVSDGRSRTTSLGPILCLANLVQELNLLDETIVEDHDILRPDVFCTIHLEEEQLITDDRELLQDVSLPGILGHRNLWGIHVARLIKGPPAMVMPGQTNKLTNQQADRQVRSAKRCAQQGSCEGRIFSKSRRRLVASVCS